MALPVSLDRRVQGLLPAAALWVLSSPFISMNIQKRQQIRSEIRKIRANLTALQQQQAEQSVTQQALKSYRSTTSQKYCIIFFF